MTFDPAWPPYGIDIESAPLRAQLNALNNQDTTTNQRIDNIQLTPGPQGPKGDPGASFPYAGNAEIDGSVFVQGELALFESDPGGSGESSVRIGRASAGGAAVPAITSRLNGTTLFNITLDFGGQADASGSPTIQNGAIWRYDQATNSLKPWNVTVQTINYTDSDGNPASMQVLVPPP